MELNNSPKSAVRSALVLAKASFFYSISEPCADFLDKAALELSVINAGSHRYPHS